MINRIMYITGIYTMGMHLVYNKCLLYTSIPDAVCILLIYCLVYTWLYNLIIHTVIPEINANFASHFAGAFLKTTLIYL